MVVTTEQREAFQRDGFVVIPDLLDADQLDRYGRAVDAAVDARAGHDDRAIADKSLYEQSFTQCMNLWEESAEVRALTFDQRLGEAAATLLGSNALRIWHDQALYKEPGGRQTDAHNDSPFWPISPSDQITAWIPFDGSVRERGAMAYVPGSHLAGVKRFVDITHTIHDEPYDVLSDPAFADIEPIWVEAPAGSVVFHHSLTVHVAGPNVTDDVRRVYCIIYFADGCVRSKDWPHMTVERQQIEIGAPVRGEVSPIAWPRSDGDLPPPPTDGLTPRVGFGGMAS